MTEDHELPWAVHEEHFADILKTTAAERELSGSKSYNAAEAIDQDFRRYMADHHLADYLKDDPYTAYVALTVGKFFAMMMQLSAYEVDEMFEEAIGSDECEDEEDAEAATEIRERDAQVASEVGAHLLLPAYVAMQRLNWAAYNHAHPESPMKEPYGETVSDDLLAHLDFEVEEVGEEEE